MPLVKLSQETITRNLREGTWRGTVLGASMIVRPLP